MSTYLHSKGRRLGLPIAGTFELTAQCNFNCPMCYVHMTREQIDASGKRELTTKEWLSIAEDAKNRGMVFVLLTGGEPLMRKDFFEIYQGMKKMGLYVSINTNGSMIQGEILDKFIEDPPYRINISLYGGNNETYQRMCGLPRYNEVKENIRNLKKAGINVSLNLSITPYNCHDLEQIYKDAEELDVNVKATTYMYPSIRVNGKQYGSNNRLSEKEAAYYAVKWDKIRFGEEEFRQRAINTSKLIAEREGCPVEADNGIACRAGSSSFWMTWDGRMLPCGMMIEPVVYPLIHGFDKAWEELRTLTSQIKTPDKCTTCSYKEVCGVCASVCYCETGRFDEVSDYVCNKTKQTVEYMKQYSLQKDIDTIT
jgi:radical SAM protein with 4Fe4S-binding SPASM domain